MTDAERTQFINLIAKDIELRLVALEKPNALGDFSSNLFTVAEIFMELWTSIGEAKRAAMMKPGVDKEFLQLAAQEVDNRLPDGWGFILLAFETNKEGRLTYVSNCERKDCIAAMKEFLLRQSPEEWLKHVQ